MKIWIICTGEKAGLWPKDCGAAEFDALSRKAQEELPDQREEKKLPWKERIFIAPSPAARETAKFLLDGGTLIEEELLAPVIPLAASDKGRRPVWLWREMARLQRAVGSTRQPESRKQIADRAERLMARITGEEKDCVLVADCVLTEELLDRARARGYTRARTGIFRYQPWERVLLTKRDVHCGGCSNNCLLADPGCGVGKDKAARGSG